MTRIMKWRVSIVLPALAAFAIAGAQTPEARPSDEIPTDEDRIERIDPVLDEAVADSTLDMRVFGRYARDDERYQRLVERFEAGDTTLLYSDILQLYFGAVYRDDFEGGYYYGLADDETDDPAAEYEKCTESLHRAPAHPHLISQAYALGSAAGRPEEELYTLLWRYSTILSIIESTGDGTVDRPYIVTHISDEYNFVLSSLDVANITGQALVYNGDMPMDRLLVEPRAGSEFQGTEVYFDISYPMPTMFDRTYWARKMTE